MLSNHEELWRRIQEFPIDEGPVALPFVRRLARENGWSGSHADRVLAEYRRFLFLAMAAGHLVTPSDAVDQAWHLHLTYSKSYWDRLCGELLGRPLHHHPTQGGADEQRKYADAYVRTLASYRRLFGAPPPADVWPDAHRRFGRDLDFQRINTREHIFVSRGRFRRVGLLAGLLAVAGFAAAFGGDIVGAVGESLHQRGSAFLLFYWKLCGAALAAGFLVRHGLRNPHDAPRAEDLDLPPYEAAYLAGGERRAVEVALLHLFSAGKLRHCPEAGTLVAEEALSGDAPLLDRALHEGARTAATPSALRAGASASLKEMAGRLRAQGLMRSAWQSFLGTAVPLALLALPVGLGVLKMVEGLGRGRPVLLLLASLLATVGAAAWMLAHPVRCSGRGQRLIKGLRKDFERRPTGSFAPGEAAVTWGTALLGVDMLSDTPWAAFKSILGPAASVAGPAGGGAEGGCAAADGCGGGCGGCGGCGG